SKPPGVVGRAGILREVPHDVLVELQRKREFTALQTEDAAVRLIDLEDRARAIERDLRCRARVFDVRTVEVGAEAPTPRDGDGGCPDVDLHGGLTEPGDLARVVARAGRRGVGREGDVSHGADDGHQDDKRGGDLPRRTMHGTPHYEL